MLPDTLQRESWERLIETTIDPTMKPTTETTMKPIPSTSPMGGRKPSRRSFPREPAPLHAELTCADGRDQRDEVHNHGPPIQLNVALAHPENENGRRNQGERIPRTSAVLAGGSTFRLARLTMGCRPDCRTLRKGSLVQIRPCLRGTEGGYQLIPCGVCTQVVRASRESLRRAPDRLRGEPGPSGGARRDCFGTLSGGRSHSLGPS